MTDAGDFSSSHADQERSGVPVGAAGRQGVIIEAAYALLTISEPADLVATLFRKLSGIVEIDTYFNYILPPGASRMILAGCKGAPPEAEAVLRELDLGVAVCGTVALTRSSMVVERVQQRADPMTELIRSFGITAYACFPLLVNEELIGTLSVGSRRRDAFEEEDLQLIEAVSHLVAVAFHRHRTQQEREFLLERESELRREAEIANSSKDKFLAMISHELRTPMTTALGWAQLLLASEDATAEQRQAAEQIEHSLQRQRRLVQDLLEVSRLQAGKLKIQRRPTPLFEVVRQTVETFHPSFDARGVSLRVEADASADPTIAIDPQRVEQVVANLIGNALKFTPAGGEVSVRLSATHEEARVEVRDSGTGIPPELLPTIFDPFVQGEKRGAAGMGLGLAIARGLVEQHGGSIVVESEGDGKGAVFSFTLPLDC